jgi:hypothetical protein
MVHATMRPKIMPSTPAIYGINMCMRVCLCVCVYSFMCCIRSHDSTRFLEQTPNAQISETQGQSAMS